MSLFSPSLAQQTLNLVEVSSVTKNEQELCRLCLNWIQEEFPEAILRQERQGLWMSPHPLTDLPCVALVGHLDTVPSAQVQRCLLEGDRVYGLGSCDMKGGVAVMMHLLKQQTSSWCNLVGIFYDREEGPYEDNGLDLLLPGLPKIDLAIVLEPTSNKVQAGCVGSMHCRLDFRGRRAHSARPWQGDNALYKLVPALSRLSQLERREVLIAGLPFYEVMSATQVGCDNPANAIPENVWLNLNYRFAPGKSREQAWQDVQDQFAEWAEIELREFAPAGEVSLDESHLKEWIERNQLEVEAKQAWTDVARLTQAGIPAVNFGPGDPAQAHQADEFVAVAALEQCFQLLQDLLGLK